MGFPKIKKRAKDFLLEEEGKISKQTVMVVGGFMGIIASGSFGEGGYGAECEDHPVGNTRNPDHCYAHNNGIKNTLDEDTGVLKSQHQHHYNHSSHASHGSHSSHGQW